MGISAHHPEGNPQGRGVEPSVGSHNSPWYDRWELHAHGGRCVARERAEDVARKLEVIRKIRRKVRIRGKADSMLTTIKVYFNNIWRRTRADEGTPWLRGYHAWWRCGARRYMKRHVPGFASPKITRNKRLSTPEDPVEAAAAVWDICSRAGSPDSIE